MGGQEGLLRETSWSQVRPWSILDLDSLPVLPGLPNPEIILNCPPPLNLPGMRLSVLWAAPVLPTAPSPRGYC